MGEDGMEQDLQGILLEGSRELGVGLSEEKVDAFTFFMEELMWWNTRVNLTSLRDPLDIVVKHFLDSLAVSPHLSPGCSLLDIGSGAGFPCLALKISDPSLQVTSIDSSQKKISFQRHIIRQLRLDRVDTIHAHLPDLRVTETLNKSYDYVVSRAFGSLGTLLRIARPFIKPAGVIIAMKGKMGMKEALEEKGIERMNMKLQKTIAFILPFTEATRTLFFFTEKGACSRRSPQKRRIIDA
jgi:16S rRNA (guanine527-N7)-methyltransferase